MTTNQILELDWREPETRETVQRVLRQIKPLAKCPDGQEVPFELIEKTVVVLEKKYNFRVRDFVPDVWSNSTNAIWRATIIDDNNLKTIKVVYGITVYEVFAKVAIYMYGCRNKVSTR